MALARNAVGIILLLIAIGYIGAYGLGGLMVGVPLAMAGALFLRPLLSDLAATCFMAPFRALLGTGGGTLRKEYSEVQGAISQRRFDDALEMVEDILADTPGEREAELLRIQICYEHLNRIEEGLTYAFAALDTLEWDETQGRMVMLAVDMLLDGGRREDAANLLAQAGQRLMNRVQREHALTRLSSLSL